MWLTWSNWLIALVVGVVEQPLEAGVTHRVAPTRPRAGSAGVLTRAPIDLHRPPRIVEVSEQVGERGGRRGRIAARPAQRADLVAAVTQRPRADHRRVAQGGERGLRRVRGGELKREAVEAGAEARRSASRGSARGPVPEPDDRRAQLGEEVVEELEVAREVVSALGGCNAVSRASRMNRATSALRAARRTRMRSASEISRG